MEILKPVIYTPPAQSYANAQGGNVGDINVNVHNNFPTDPYRQNAAPVNFTAPSLATRMIKNAKNIVATGLMGVFGAGAALGVYDVVEHKADGVVGDLLQKTAPITDARSTTHVHVPRARKTLSAEEVQAMFDKNARHQDSITNAQKPVVQADSVASLKSDTLKM